MKALSGMMLAMFLLGMLTSMCAVQRVAAPQEFDWWPMRGHDLNHSGCSLSPAPNTNNVTWSSTTGNGVTSSPAVVDGKVFVGSVDCSVYCLDALTGANKWKYTTGNDVLSSPAVVGGKVYVGSHDGNVYCLDASTGGRIWNYTTGLYVFSSPAVTDSRVYVGSYDCNVYCLDASTGAQIWKCTTGGEVYSSPAVADGKVYVGSHDRNVYCLNASTGARIWNYTTGDEVYSSPAVADGKVYVGSYDGKVYAFRGAHVLIVPDQYSTIQEAVNNAADGDTIFVRAGTYYEHAIVNKTVSLVGEDRSTTIVDGGGTGCVIYVLRDDVSITGFTIQRGEFGIYVLNATYAEIFSNTMAHNRGSGGGTAVRLDSAGYTLIHDNEITDNWRAIHLIASSPNVSVCRNNVTYNDFGIRVLGGGSNYLSVSGNYIANNLGGYGVAVTGIGGESNYALISGNVIVNNIDGVALGQGSSYNTVVQNNISGNEYGIGMQDSAQNSIRNNNIVNNTYQVSITSGSVNGWNGSYAVGGNYWSDYSGLDKFSGPYQNVTGSDGIGDTPYVIDANNRDNYPLINPWSQLLQGDINDDGTVDIFDAILLANAFNTVPGMPNWNPNADFNTDEVVDIFDAIILANNFGKQRT